MPDFRCVSFSGKRDLDLGILVPQAIAKIANGVRLYPLLLGI